MFSLTDLDLENAPIIGPVEEGIYRVRILDLAIYDQKAPKDGQYMTAALDVVSVANAETVRHFISMIPAPGTTDKDAVRAKSRIKQFFDAFGLPYNLQPTEGEGKKTFPGAVGAEAIIVLGLGVGQDGTTPENKVKSLTPPTPAA